MVGLHSPESLETESSQERSGRSRIPRPDPPPPRGGSFQFEGINQVDDTVKKEEKKEKKIVECVDADQIDRDTARCTWHLLTGESRITSRVVHHHKLEW